MDRTPSPEKVSRAVRWAVLLFLAYALWHGVLHPVQHPQPGPASGSAVTAGLTGAPQPQPPAQDCAGQNPLKNFSLFAMPFMPSLVPATQVQELAAGKGPAAVCGQDASLRYEYALPSGTVIFSNLDSGDPETVTIGGGELLNAVESSLLGMQTGAERRIVLPPALGFAHADAGKLRGADRFTLKPVDLKDSNITGTVKLLSLSPAPPDSTMPMRVIDRRFARGTQAHCGERVRVDMTIWKTDGTQVFSTLEKGSVAFTPGLSEMPYGIEQAVIGMPEGGQRMIILPAALARPLKEGKSSVLPDIAREEETLLVELHLLHVGNDVTPHGAQAPAPEAAPQPAPTPKAAAPAETKEEGDDDNQDATNAKDKTP